MPGVHVAHFCPMCLTTRNGLRHPKSPVMPRTSPTRFDAWSSRGGRLERTQGEHPHVLGLRVTARGRSPATLLLSPCYPPSEHANSTPSRRGRSGLWRRRAVRAPVGDAAAPSRRATRSKDAGRRAGRSSSPAGSCLSAMGGAAARGTCAACAARARPCGGGPLPHAMAQHHSSAPPRHARPTRRALHRPLAVRSSWPCCAPHSRARLRLRQSGVARACTHPRRQKHALLVAFAESDGGCPGGAPARARQARHRDGWLSMHLPKKGVQVFRFLQAAWVSLSL